MTEQTGMVNDGTDNVCNNSEIWHRQRPKSRNKKERRHEKEEKLETADSGWQMCSTFTQISVNKFSLRVE